MTRSHDFRSWRLGAVLLILCGNAGCSFQEALLDGFFGGISDTIAAIVSNLFLGGN